MNNIWKQKRISATNHIARLPYDNPARIILFGEPMLYFKDNKKRKFRTVKETLYKDINEILDEEYYSKLCDRTFKSVSLHQTLKFS